MPLPPAPLVSDDALGGLGPRGAPCSWQVVLLGVGGALVLVGLAAGLAAAGPRAFPGGGGGAS